MQNLHIFFFPFTFGLYYIKQFVSYYTLIIFGNVKAKLSLKNVMIEHQGNYKKNNINNKSYYDYTKEKLPKESFLQKKIYGIIYILTRSSNLLVNCG